MTILKMLIGAINQVVHQVATKERDQHLMDNVRTQVQSIVDELDPDHCGILTWEEFDLIMEHPLVLGNLSNLGVDIDAFLDTIRFVSPREGLSVAAFSELTMQF